MKILAVVLVLIGIQVVFMVVKNTRIPGGLGVHEGKLSPVPTSPNAVSSQSEDPDKKVEPIPFQGGLKESIEWIKEGLRAYGSIEILEEEENYIHAVHTTGKMKYKDDIEFYFDDESALIQFRSASRIGYSDMGLNRQRYDRFRELLKERL
jgi:uncharacterized protein (DUF1499 family)